jgi:hypothetical protein
MATQSVCAIYGGQDSWRHSLVECHHARSVWDLAPEEVNDFIVNLQEPHRRAWLATIIKELSHGEATRVVVTLWALWHARRKIIHEDLYQSPLSTKFLIERFLSDLQLLEPVKESATTNLIPRPSWIPPLEGIVKVNVNAALSKNSSRASIVKGRDLA